jgi:hypothetical protein
MNMKKILFFFFPVFLLTALNSYGQASSQNDSLAGSWHLLNYSETSDTLIFERETIATIQHYGYRIELNKADLFVDAYSAKCGNDNNIHNDRGTWKISKDRVLITSIPISADKATRHKVVSVTGDRLILKKMN